MIKKLLVVSLAALGIGFMGCDNPLSNDDTVSIELNAVPTITANTTYYDIVATVNGSVAITNVTPSIKRIDGGDTTGISFDQSATPSKEKISIKATGGDMSITMNFASTTCNGDYVLTLTATAGTVQTSQKSTFTVTGKTDCSIPDGTPIVTTTLTAGANKNSEYGSSIDLDGGVVWKMADAATNVAKIDLCYAHASTGADKLGTTAWATASLFDFAKAWTTASTAKFYLTDLSAAEFDEITISEEIPDFVDASAIASSEALPDDVFIVKTTEGAIVLVKITAQTPGEAGTITIKSAK
jgi:hypothetical protein